MRSLHDNLFFGYYALHIPLIVCLISGEKDEVMLNPCHVTLHRPFTDQYVDKIVLESDKYALGKLFF